MTWTRSLLLLSILTSGCLPPQAPPTPPAADTRPAAEKPSAAPAGEIVLDGDTGGEVVRDGDVTLSLLPVSYPARTPEAPLLRLVYKNTSEARRTPAWHGHFRDLTLRDEHGNDYTLRPAPEATRTLDPLYPGQENTVAWQSDRLVARAKRLEATLTVVLPAADRLQPVRIRFSR